MDTHTGQNVSWDAGAVPIVAAAEATSNADSAQTPADTIRVLHVINGEFYAGAERVQDLLALRLPEFGFQTGFACLKLDLFDEMRESRSTPLYNLPMWNRFDLRVAYQVADIVRREKYRLIHGHTVRTAMIGAMAAKLANIPMVYHAHSPTTHDTTHPWRDRFNGFVERLSLHGVSRIIAVSKAIANEMIQAGFDGNRITVIYNGVPSPRAPMKSQPARDVPLGTWTLGTMALFRPRKGTETLLEALALLRRQGIPVHLRAVGGFETPEYESEIVHLLRRLGLQEHVSWTGFTRETMLEFHKMDLFVLPSLFGEGLPMVILEAMASGVPVVATYVGGIPEAIRDGQDGLLVAPGNPIELANAIARIIRGEVAWPTLRANALARHNQMFSDRSMAAGVAKVYREVLASP